MNLTRNPYAVILVYKQLCEDYKQGKMQKMQLGEIRLNGRILLTRYAKIELYKTAQLATSQASFSLN